MFLNIVHNLIDLIQKNYFIINYIRKNPKLMLCLSEKSEFN